MTLPPHGPPEITETQQAATSLGEVEDPTPDNVSRALQDYSPYAVAAAAASLGASGGGGGGSQPCLTATATLDNGDVLALPTTPVEIIADVGAGKCIVVGGGAVLLNLAGDYTNVGEDAAFDIQTGPFGNRVYPTTRLSGDLDGENAPDALLWRVAPFILNGDGSNASTFLADDPQTSLSLVAVNQDAEFNDLGDFTGGDPDNAMTVTLYYVVLDIPS